MRPSKEQYYLDIALTVSKRSTCLRRQYGAVIVKDDVIISTGYNGSPRGAINCCDKGTCTRQELNIPAGERYECCEALHAEYNAILAVKYSDMIDGTIYLAGYDLEKKERIQDPKPCMMCDRAIRNCKLKFVGKADN